MVDWLRDGTNLHIICCDFQVKERLLETLDCVLDQISKWVESKQCSPEFISTVANDLKHRESTARRKV